MADTAEAWRPQPRSYRRAGEDDSGEVGRNAADWHRVALLPKVWIAEPTFSRFSNFRCLPKAYAFSAENTETMFLIAGPRLLLPRRA